MSYEDLLVLYSRFYDKHGRPPLAVDCTYSNGLPHIRAVNRVLKSSGATYKDLLRTFGKNGHVRASISDYDIYVERFKSLSKELGSAPIKTELTGAAYNLPSSQWFIDHCPDCSVRTYKDFVRWCGCELKKKVWTKEEVRKRLISFEDEHKRNVVREDITTENIGFSMIVINRIFGSLENARVECGLNRLSPRGRKDHKYYIDSLRDIVTEYVRRTGCPYISWDDIESGDYGCVAHNHKTYTNHFKASGIDLFEFVRSLGCMFNESGYSDSYVLENGELTRSSFEYDFTTYLNKVGFVYKQDYDRDVYYSTFSDTGTRMSCDYVLQIGDTSVYIEIAGVLSSLCDTNWRTYDLRDSRHKEYREALLQKDLLFRSAGVEYYILFPCDMKSGGYKRLIDSLRSRSVLCPS